jgi:hypothetical protein
MNFCFSNLCCCSRFIPVPCRLALFAVSRCDYPHHHYHHLFLGCLLFCTIFVKLRVLISFSIDFFLGTYKSYSAYYKDETAPIFFDPTRVYSTVYITLNFSRQSFGIIFRLALPITIFLFIVGFSFWAEEDKRIDITVNMLLVISALYLVIGQVIPFVGYYTTLDLYITTSFILLAITCGIHFLVLQFNRKKDKYPLLELVSYAIVYFFRLVWLPMAIFIFIFFFNLDQVYILVPFILVTIGSIVNTAIHYKQYKKVYQNTFQRLKEKHQSTDERVSLSKTETLIISAGALELTEMSDKKKKHNSHQGQAVVTEYLSKLHEQKEAEEEEVKEQQRIEKQTQRKKERMNQRISEINDDSDDES